MKSGTLLSHCNGSHKPFSPFHRLSLFVRVVRLYAVRRGGLWAERSRAARREMRGQRRVQRPEVLAPLSASARDERPSDALQGFLVLIAELALSSHHARGLMVGVEHRAHIRTGSTERRLKGTKDELKGFARELRDQ